MQFRNEKRDREEEIRTTKAVSRNTHNRELVILTFVLAVGNVACGTDEKWGPDQK